MERTHRVSVRELVAFSCFAPDVMPSADQEALATGTLAHKARQAEVEAQIEESIRHVYEREEISLLVFGRMDAFVDGEEPFVEEIKHCRILPDEVRVEHRMQALCYAAMLAEEKQCAFVRFCVCYVNLDGDVLRSFEERLSALELRQQMDTLLIPYARFAAREEKHREFRNQSLRKLPFPFASYRKGQRELAVQVYTAISRKKRLFASLPTGTGKSAAVLYPALKALGEGKTERIVYLTARNTARQSPVNALQKMQEAGMKARCTVLTAREKLCPAITRCHPDDCPRARGHFLRQGDAIDDLLRKENLVWDDPVIREQAERFSICPFEFALSLCELADVILMDLNYAFDPFAQVKRLFQRQKNFTLLVDEAHHTVDRVRENLSGTMDSRELACIRTEYGKQYGRKNSVYRSLGVLVKTLRELDSAEEGILASVPEEVISCVKKTLEEATDALGHMSAGMPELIRLCLPFLYAYEHLDEDYAVLLEKHGKERTLTLYCLLPGKEITRITKNLRGTVFFSATLSPLPAMKQLLGGEEEDACFALPSPFPRQHLQVVRKRIGTRYGQRENSAKEIADAIAELMHCHPGNTIAFFPSYAYQQLVYTELEKRVCRIWVQERDMGEQEREAFLQAFEDSREPLLGLCVLGGLFSEGIDLPGKRLVNAVIVGVGLPVPSMKLGAIRNCYQKHFGDGFAYACRIPGMQKVQQAAGRVIRSETDKGMVLLLDDRYYDAEYEAMLPSEWMLWNEETASAARKLEERSE